MSRTVLKGDAYPLGAVYDGKGVNFAIFSSTATKVEVCLFDETGKHEERIVLPEYTDEVFHGYIVRVFYYTFVGVYRTGRRYTDIFDLAELNAVSAHKVSAHICHIRRAAAAPDQKPVTAQQQITARQSDFFIKKASPQLAHGIKRDQPRQHTRQTDSQFSISQKFDKRDTDPAKEHPSVRSCFPVDTGQQPVACQQHFPCGFRPAGFNGIQIGGSQKKKEQYTGDEPEKAFLPERDPA